jgi:hypothetical protein
VTQLITLLLSKLSQIFLQSSNFASPFVELGGSAEFCQHLVRNAVDTHQPVALPLLPGSATCRGNSFSRTALKDSSFSRLRISEAERGDPPQDTPRRASEKMKGQGNSRARALIDNCNLDPQLKK